MPKIKPIHLNKSVVTENVKKAASKTERIIKDVNPVNAGIDISTEELGFFLYNGKAYSIIFPR